MKDILIASIMLFLVSIFSACSEKKVENLVDIRQIQPDGSNDYRVIFSEQIDKERSGRNKYRKNEFR